MAELERAEKSRPFLRVYLVGHPSHACGGKWCIKAADEEALGRGSRLMEASPRNVSSRHSAACMPANPPPKITIRLFTETAGALGAGSGTEEVFGAVL
jgi:hypothetical protein